MDQGKFITFEGGEGSGKSTQVSRLQKSLEARGLDVVVTREPGGSPFAERLRNVLLDPDVGPHDALSEALLFYAARADHLAQVIQPALDGGRWVLCDRFSDSTRVYQGYAGTVDTKILEALELIVVGRRKPDLTLILDIPPEIGLARAEVRRDQHVASRTDEQVSKKDDGRVARGLLADRYESRSIDFHRRLRDGFLAIAREEPERCTVIDGQVDAETVSAEIWKAVEERLLGAKKE